MSLEYCGGVFSGQVYCWWPLTWQEIRPELFQKYYALCDGVLGVFKFQGVLSIIN